MYIFLEFLICVLHFQLCCIITILLSLISIWHVYFLAAYVPYTVSKNVALSSEASSSGPFTCFSDPW
jgi:hypothetical protein